MLSLFLMSDRRSQQLPPSSSPQYPMQQWNNQSQYQTNYSPPGHFPAPCNPSLRQNSNLTHHQIPYDPMMAQTNSMDYQATHQYSHDRTSMPMQHQAGYPHVDCQSAAAMAQATGGQHSRPTPHGYPNTRQQQAISSNPYATAPAYPSPQPPTQTHPHSQTIPQYPAPMSFPSTEGSSQYPASPQRPFSCDMCALSFNRQHDLKRHRDTHTGEKPFLCNGGCGKTFTRKDALKRHQVRCV